MSLSPFAAVQTCRNSRLMVEARGRWHRGWAKGYFLSTTWRPLEYWSPSQRNKKPNIGWKGRECRIAIGQNTKREIPSCNENPTTIVGRCFVIEWAFNTFPRLATTLLNLIASINFCKRKCIISTTTATFCIISTTASSSPETAILGGGGNFWPSPPKFAPNCQLRGIEGAMKEQIWFSLGPRVLAKLGVKNISCVLIRVDNRFHQIQFLLLVFCSLAPAWSYSWRPVSKWEKKADEENEWGK